MRATFPDVVGLHDPVGSGYRHVAVTVAVAVAAADGTGVQAPACHAEAVPSDEWARWRREVDLEGYDERWARMAAAGENPHGEVDLVVRYQPRSVLDAGCGTGRVAVELDRRGVEVVGTDLDPDLLDRARRKAPHLTWVEADLAELDLGRTFDVVVLAGNVIGFVAAERRSAAVERLAAHVAPGGRLVSGAQLRAGWPDTGTYDGWCEAAGLVLEDRFATWDGEPFAPGGGYAVAVHRRPG